MYYQEYTLQVHKYIYINPRVKNQQLKQSKVRGQDILNTFKINLFNGTN